MKIEDIKESAKMAFATLRANKLRSSLNNSGRNGRSFDGSFDGFDYSGTR